jgi:hypothetical protein
MKIVKYILMFFIFYSLSGCYTQLALNGDSDYYSNGNDEEYSNEEYAYEDTTTAEPDSSYYGNEGEEEQPSVINNYYFDNDFWPGDFYRRYYWGYYPGIAVTIGGGDFYDWYWDNLNWYNWDCCYYNYYDPYFYNPYYYDPYYVWDGYYNGDIAPVYKYRSRNLTRLRNTHGGRGLALLGRSLRNSNGRTTASSAANRRRDERTGRNFGISRTVSGSRPTRNGAVNGLSNPTVNGRKSSVQRNGRKVRNSSSDLRRERGRSPVESRRKSVRRPNTNTGRKVRKENPHVERRSGTVHKRAYKAPRKSGRRYEPKSKPRSYSTPKSESRRSYYHPQSRESYPSHSSYTPRSYSPSSSSSRSSGSGYSRSSGSSGRSSRSSSRGSSSRRR